MRSPDRRALKTAPLARRQDADNQVFSNCKGRMLVIDLEDWNQHSKKPAKFRSDAVATNRKK
jgi:hypothetical protein